MHLNPFTYAEFPRGCVVESLSGITVSQILIPVLRILCVLSHGRVVIQQNSLSLDDYIYTHTHTHTHKQENFMDIYVCIYKY